MFRTKTEWDHLNVLVHDIAYTSYFDLRKGVADYLSKVFKNMMKEVKWYISFIHLFILRKTDIHEHTCH